MTAAINPGFRARHTFKLQLPAMPHSQQVFWAEALCAALSERDGMEFARLRMPGAVLSLSYDASQQQLGEILQWLDNQGVSPATGWWNRTRLSMALQVDANILANARHQPHCCNQVPAAPDNRSEKRI
jgi:hypothetical protein